jgi:predicted Zn-dependent protease
VKAALLVAALGACAWSTPVAAKPWTGVSLDDLPRYDDPAVTRYVSSVVRRLARASGDRRPWSAVILDDPAVGASTTCSALYLQRGTLAALRSEAELAAVLAHEMSHVRGGHCAGDAASDTDRHSRDDEIQADEHAVVMLTAAGYDPRAVATALRAVAALDDAEALEATDVDATHPKWPERIARAQALATTTRGELGEARYRAGLAMLVVGDDPRRTAVRIGNAAVFAKARRAVDLPAGTIDIGDGGTIGVTMPDGARVALSAVPAFMRHVLPELLGVRTSAYAYEVVGDQVLVFVASGNDARAHLRSVRAALRPARPAEIERVRPRLVRFDTPRRLWPSSDSSARPSCGC